MQGEPFLDILAPNEDEHWPFVVSSWPHYFAEGEITADVGSWPRRISNYMPLTIAIWDRSLILGGPTTDRNSTTSCETYTSRRTLGTPALKRLKPYPRRHFRFWRSKAHLRSSWRRDASPSKPSCQPGEQSRLMVCARFGSFAK
jgi:hypothetical protein